MHQTIAPYAVVADDNPVIALHVIDILSDAGFSVFAASGADDALRWFEAHGQQVVLLFTNVEMPGSLAGFGLARQIAKQSPVVAILVSSGRFIPGPGDMPPGAIFVPKPFTEQDVLRAARQVLSVRHPSLLPALAL